MVDSLGNCKTYCSKKHYITARLELWQVEPVLDVFEGEVHYRLLGFVYDDQTGRFLDKEYIHTSRVKLGAIVMAALPGDVIETNGSFYLLGEPA